MSDRFLETDEILQSLVIQLEKFKSTSEQLTLAGENASDLTDACDELVDVCKQLVAHNKKQLDATVQLVRDTEERLHLLMDAQQASAASTAEKLESLAVTLATNERVVHDIHDTLEKRGTQIDTVEQTLQNDVKPLLQRLKGMASVIRAVIFILLALLLANGALAAYIVRLLSN